MEPGSRSPLQEQAIEPPGLHPSSSLPCVAWWATCQVQDQSRPHVQTAECERTHGAQAQSPRAKVKGKASLAVWLGHLPRRFDGTEECRFESASWKQGLQGRGGNWERWGQTQRSSRTHQTEPLLLGNLRAAESLGQKWGNVLFLLSFLAWQGVVPKRGYVLITSMI